MWIFEETLNVNVLQYITKITRNLNIMDLASSATTIMNSILVRCYLNVLQLCVTTVISNLWYSQDTGFNLDKS
jgi:hypothetical protein